MRLNTRDIQILNLFESMTKARANDVIDAEGSMNFLVKEGDLGLAIGKKGVNIKKVSHALGQRVHAFEDSDDLTKFVRNLSHPLTPMARQEGGKVRIEFSRKDRSELPGRKIRLIRELVKRKFDAESVEFDFN